MDNNAPPQEFRKWAIRAAVVFFVWDLPQWVQAIFGLFTSEPLIPWLQRRGLTMPHFSPFWITGSVAIMLLCCFAWVDWNHRKKLKSKTDERFEPVSDLEIEFIPSSPTPAKKHPCQIRIHNKSPIKNADDLKVELVSYADECSAEQAEYYHPKFPYILKPDSKNNTINPLDIAVFTIFYFESASKIEGREQKFVAGFDSGKSTEKNYALFHEKKNYPIKLSASARGMARVEKEFIMVFSNELGIGRINLKPIIHLSEEEKRGKAEKAIEKLTDFSTVFFQRICAIRAMPATEYNPDKDDALWNANCAAIAYIQLNLNDAAGKIYDEGVAEINTYSIPRSGFGSTRFDDDKNVVLARFNKRILNLKRIVENIDSYLK